MMGGRAALCYGAERLAGFTDRQPGSRGQVGTI